MAGQPKRKKKQKKPVEASNGEVAEQEPPRDSQQLEPEMVSLAGQAAEEAAAESPEPEAAAPDLSPTDLTNLLSEMPAPSPLDSAIRSLVEVLLPGPEQPRLTEEAAASASAALGRMVRGDDDSLSLAVGQSDGVLHGLVRVCNTARSDSARAAAAESLGILALNDANKVSIRCTGGFGRGLVRVCTEAVERVERRSALMRTVRDATLALKEAKDTAERASTGRDSLAPDPWAAQDLEAHLRFLRQQRSEALRELESDAEPAAAADDAMVAGASTLACLMESTVTSDRAANTVEACDKRIVDLDAQVLKAKQIVAAAGSAERATHSRLTLLYAFNKWLHTFRPVDPHDRTLVAAAREARRSAMQRTVNATAVVRTARNAHKDKQRELSLANGAREKAMAVELAAALGPADIHVDSEHVADLKKNVSHLANLCAQRQRQADASLVRLLENKWRQWSTLHPRSISWEPRGLPRQPGAHLARTQRQVEMVDTVPIQEEFVSLSREELSRLCPTQPLPGFLSQMNPPKAAELMASTLEQVCKGEMVASEMMETHLRALRGADVEDCRAELVQWMEKTDLATAISDLQATREACREAVTIQSLAFAVYQAADINKEALGQRAIATLTRVCKVTNHNGAKAKAASALGALATHEGLAAWMVGESRGCLQALAGVIDICEDQNERAVLDAVPATVHCPARRHQQPRYFTCDREEAWTCAARALGVVAGWHPHAVASTTGVIKSLTAMCTNVEKISEKHRDAAREAAATALQHLVTIGLFNGVEDLQRKYGKTIRKARRDREVKARHDLQRPEQEAKEGEQKYQQQQESPVEEEKQDVDHNQLGQWTEHVTMDEVVAGLVNVCTTGGTQRTQAAAATALANLICPTSHRDNSHSVIASFSNKRDQYRFETGLPTWNDTRAACAATISRDGTVVEVCLQLCNAEASSTGSVSSDYSVRSQQRVVEAGARLLWHLAATDASLCERIVQVGGLGALVHVCNTAEADSTLSAAAGALDCCSVIEGAVQKLGKDATAVSALVRCCNKLTAGSVGMGGAASVLSALARNGFPEMIRDTNGAAEGLRRVCEFGPTDGKMFAARCLARLAALG